MPMYFPDLESVKRLAESMSKHEGNKQYIGIIPQSEEDLIEARKQLGDYLRDVWNDEVFAVEVELAVDKDDYDKKMSNYFISKFQRIGL